MENSLKSPWLRNYWELDLVASLVSAVIFGYWTQVIADSGSKDYEKIIWSILIGVFSYVLPYIASICFRGGKYRISWIWVGIGGSIVYAFNLKVIRYSIANWNPIVWDSVNDYALFQLRRIAWELPLTIIVITFWTLIFIVFFRLVIEPLLAMRRGHLK